MVYKLCKRLIETNRADKMQEKLDVFLVNDRLTAEEYTELTGLLKGGTPA